MNTYNLNSNDTDLNLPQHAWIRVENVLLTVGNILYYPCRGTSEKILKIEINDDVTIQFYIQGYPIYIFDVDILLLGSSNSYQINEQLY